MVGMVVGVFLGDSMKCFGNMVVKCWMGGR